MLLWLQPRVTMVTTIVTGKADNKYFKLVSRPDNFSCVLTKNLYIKAGNEFLNSKGTKWICS